MPINPFGFQGGGGADGAPDGVVTNLQFEREANSLTAILTRNAGLGVLERSIGSVWGQADEVTRKVDDILAGKLGYTWYFAIKETQDFTGDDFVHELGGRIITSNSEFPDLVTPEFDEVNTFFGAIAIPLDIHDGEISTGAILHDQGYIYNLSYRRLMEPVFIHDRPYKVYVGLFMLNPEFYSLAARRWESRPVVYPWLPMYAIATETPQAPDFSDDWIRSNTPILNLPDFGGVDRYVHILRRANPDPNIIMLNESGSMNIVNSFERGFTPIMANGLALYPFTSNVALSHGDYSSQELIVLPNRSDISYFSPPTVFADEDIGFTWYAGFYSRPAGGSAPILDRPIIDELQSNSGVGTNIGDVDYSMSTRRQLVLPDNNDGGRYQPSGNNRYAVRFIAIPVGVAQPSGLLEMLRTDYRTEESIVEASETEWVDNWRHQRGTPGSVGPTPIMINGVEYYVYHNRAGSRLIFNQYGGRRLHLFNNV